MLKIVISYRRQDSDAIAGRIRDRLVVQFSADAVFMDIESIPAGVDFREYVANTLENTDVVLAVIGPKWAGGLRKQKARIYDPTDPLRIEIEKAFELKIPLLPVLVNGAVMPEADKLPDSLKDLAFRNATLVDTGRDFHPHVDRLIQEIYRITGSSPADPSFTGREDQQPAGPDTPAGLMRRMARTIDLSKFQVGNKPVRYALAFAVVGLAILLPFIPYGTRNGQIDPSPTGTVPPQPVRIAPVECRQEPNLRSLGTTMATSIVFRNTGEKTIRLYWLDYEGKRILYGTLNHSQVLSQRTYVSHPWVVTDDQDRCKAIYLPAAQDLEIDIAI